MLCLLFWLPSKQGSSVSAGPQSHLGTSCRVVYSRLTTSGSLGWQTGVGRWEGPPPFHSKLLVIRSQIWGRKKFLRKFMWKVPGGAELGQSPFAEVRLGSSWIMVWVGFSGIALFFQLWSSLNQGHFTATETFQGPCALIPPLSFFLFSSFIDVQCSYHTIHPLKVCNSLACSMFTGLCFLHHNHFRTFTSAQKYTLCPSLSQHPNCPSHWTSVSIDLPILDMAYTWNYTICPWLLMFSKAIPVIVCISTFFFLSQNNIWL